MFLTRQMFELEKQIKQYLVENPDDEDADILRALAKHIEAVRWLPGFDGQPDKTGGERIASARATLRQINVPSAFAHVGFGNESPLLWTEPQSGKILFRVDIPFSIELNGTEDLAIRNRLCNELESFGFEFRGAGINEQGMVFALNGEESRLTEFYEIVASFAHECDDREFNVTEVRSEDGE